MKGGERSAALALLAHRLSSRTPLHPEVIDAISTLPAEVVPVRPHGDFVRAGETVNHSCLISDGLVARFDQLQDGRRQIVSLHIPGDLVDLYSLMLPQVPAPLQALCHSTVMRIPHAALRATIERFPDLSGALWRESIVDACIVSQTVVRLGRRDARARVAHLLCEMAIRYDRIGARERTGYRLPITQEQLADTLGLTSVHVNRMLRQLREEQLVAVASGRVELLDWDGLKIAGEFDPAYLCLPGSIETVSDALRMG